MPESALREALVNAVIHRDYAVTGSQILLDVFDDRVAVTSPGALPNHMTVEQARRGGAPRSRNEMMANAMVVRGLTRRACCSRSSSSWWWRRCICSSPATPSPGRSSCRS